MTAAGTSAFSSGELVTSNIVRLPRPTRILINEQSSGWTEEVAGRLESLIRLERGWDGYRAEPVSFINASYALQMLNSICGTETPAPQVVPGLAGDLQVEWHTLQGDLEIHVTAPNDVHAWRVLAHGNPDGEEMRFTNDFRVVANWVREITESPIAAAAAA